MPSPNDLATGGSCLRYLRYRSALYVGLAVLGAGFGMMVAFWHMGRWDTRLPGFYSYRSAVLGDGVLLPLAASILTLACLRLPPAPSERRWLLSVAFVGCLTGAATQVLWLLDDNPRPNWTLPVAHHYNIAGVYHAVFLIVIAGFLASSLTLVLYRLRWLGTRKAQLASKLMRSWYANALVAALLSFVGILTLDNLASGGTTATASTAVAVLLGILLVGGSLAWAAKGRLLATIRGFTMAIVIALFFSLATIKWPPSSMMTVNVVTNLCLTASLADYLRRGDWQKWQIASALTGLVTFALSTIGLALLSYRSWVVSLLFFAAAIGMSAWAAVWVRIRRPSRVLTKELRQEAVSLVLSRCCLLTDLFFIGFLREYRHVTPDLLTLIIWLAQILLITQVANLIKQHFERLMDAERELSHPLPAGEAALAEIRVRQRAVSMWTQILSMGLPTLLTLLVLLSTALHRVGFDRTAKGDAGGAGILVLAAAGAFVATATGAALMHWSSRSRHGEVPYGKQISSALSREALIWLLVAAAIWAIAPLLALRRPLELLGPAVALGGIFGYLVFESLVANCAWLHLQPARRGMKLVAFGYGLAVMVQTVWLLAIGLWSAGVLANVGSVVLNASLVVFGSAVLVLAGGCVISNGMRIRTVTLHPPWQNLIQDHALYALLLVVGGVVPVIVAAKHYALGRVELVPSALLLLTNLPGIGLLAFYPWVLRNNCRHVRSEMRRRPPTLAQLSSERHDSIRNLQRMRIRRLRSHVFQQNGLSVAVLLVGLVWIIVLYIDWGPIVNLIQR